MKKSIRNSALGILILSSTALMTGCASDYSGSVYSGSQARQAQKVQYGTIQSIRPVKINGKESNLGVGSLGGAALGGIAGSQIGGGLGRAAGAVGGAVIGGLAGNAIEGKVREQNGIEIQVKLDSGRQLSIVQAAEKGYAVGQKVRVIGNGRDARVSPY